ncbi:MAG: DUF6051 family protein [Spirochaetales bacterium]|uniref:DUF6051 family protein n=1 Tax=Candidatus Thalassospirochaeta sargassi TaxID=3119039 RepID=A0AAJ1IDJ6_9SPIO|nr:DUF6051 family protein [Spirochaetales bacterium]
MKTDYINDFNALSRSFDLDISFKTIDIEGHKSFDLLSCPFKSTADFVYPESGDYSSKGSTFTALLKYYLSTNTYSNELIFNELENPDKNVMENNKFRIPIFKPAGNRRFNRAVILLHGLNEKRWEKYLPWALRIMEETDSPVILFPIAFHMNRAPEAWGSPRDMMKVAAERKNFVNEGTQTSFLNAALSHRIQFAPHRFFSSGLQTYYDIISLIDEIRLGTHPFLERNCKFDFFSYSIGASLTEVLLTSNQNNYFENSNAFLFCGGAALDTADPVSKTIIDKAAYTELFSWFGTLFESVTEMSRRVRDIFFQDLPEVLNFKSFLFYDRMQSFREASLRKMSGNIMVLGLDKDKVFPPASTRKTIKGFNEDIDIEVGSMDFPFEYRHEDPFPLLNSQHPELNAGFEEVFSKACSFLNKTA